MWWARRRRPPGARCDLVKYQLPHRYYRGIHMEFIGNLISSTATNQVNGVSSRCQDGCGFKSWWSSQFKFDYLLRCPWLPLFHTLVGLIKLQLGPDRVTTPTEAHRLSTRMQWWDCTPKPPDILRNNVKFVVYFSFNVFVALFHMISLYVDGFIG